MDGREKAAVRKDGGGVELSAGVASGDAKLTRECRGLAVSCLWTITQTPGDPHPQSGQGSHSKGPGVRYYCQIIQPISDILRHIGENYAFICECTNLFSNLQNIPESVFIFCDSNALTICWSTTSLSLTVSDETPNIFLSP